MNDFLRVRSIEEMLAEMREMEVVLKEHSWDEVVDFNTALNACIISGDKSVIKALHSILKLLVRSLETQDTLSDNNYKAKMALKKECLFTPDSLYQIKEDLETVSQLHSNYKKETAHLIEEGQIAIQRNATLKIKVMDLEAQLAGK